MLTAKIEHFPELEGSGLTDKALIYLQALRYIADVPIYVTSAVRLDDTDSAHSFGVALDISDNPTGQKLSSQWRHQVLPVLYALGLRRIGIYDRHIHFDLSTSHPQDVSWWATSD